MAGRVQDVAALQYSDLDPEDEYCVDDPDLITVNLNGLKTDARKTFIFAATYNLIKDRQKELEHNDKDFLFPM